MVRRRRDTLIARDRALAWKDTLSALISFKRHAGWQAVFNYAGDHTNRLKQPPCHLAVQKFKIMSGGLVSKASARFPALLEFERLHK